ncbi:uncharacterized protein [Amphiura filiformis]|uniref:uncharacterized protein n=1 Tax=Amphiura filiformis TaxID=82378 RepID=UPI003B20F601
MTFSLTATRGEVTAYLSTQMRSPNEAFHQWSVVATEKNPMAQVFIDTTMQDGETRKKRQAADDDQLVLYGTVVNEEPTPAGTTDTTAASRTEAVFSVLVEEGDTRIITTTTEKPTEKLATTTASTSALPPGMKISESGLSAGVVAGIAIAGFIVIFLVIAFVVVFLIKRRRSEKAEPNLINRGRNVSTVSTMSAEMRRQSETTNVYDNGPNGATMAYDAGASTSGGAVGTANGGMVGDLTNHLIKTGRMEKDSNPRNENVYTFGESTSRPNRNDNDDIYVVSEFNGKKTVAQDDVYEVTPIGQDDVYEVTEFP